MLVIQYILFNSLIYFFGRGSVIALRAISKNKFNFFESKFLGLPSNFFYHILGLFFVGNTVFIINFFTGVDNLFTYSFFLVILFSNLFKIKKIKLNLIGTINHLVTPALLSITSIGMGLHNDASLYHMAYQNWLRTEKIVIGLSNLHGRFGFSSIYDHISSIFWIDNNYILLHFLNLIFFGIFFNFLVFNLFLNKKGFLFYSSLFVLGFGLLDNFGISGGRNGFIYIEGVGKQDVAFAVIFFIASTLFLDTFLRKDFSIESLIILTLLTLFSTQLRVMGGSLLIFEIIFILSFLKKSSFKNLFAALSPFIVLTFLWLLKNLIISGCLFYPIESLCFTSFNWYVDGQATKEATATAEFFYGLSTEENIIAWYKHWFASDFNKTLSYNFGISYIILFLARVVFFKATEIDFKTTGITILFLAANFYFWINNAPGIRFLMGSLLVAVNLLAIGNLALRFNSKTFKLIYNFKILLLLITTCIALLPRSYQYSVFANTPAEVHYIKASEVELKKNPAGWGFLPVVGDECGINIECIPYKKKITESNLKFFQYKLFK